MSSQKKLLLLAAALVVVIVVAATFYNRLSAEEGIAPALPPVAEAADSQTPAEEEAVLAPDFTVVDAEGNSVALSDHLGQPVVLNFWASWCGPCKSEMPAFDAVSAELAGQVQFMMVNLTDGNRETMDSATAFIAAEGYSFPLLFDTEAAAATAYAVRSIPMTLFIDAEGRIQAYSAGAIDEDLLRQGIDLITAPAQ